MQRTHIYIPDDLDREIEYLAKLLGETKAAVIRRILAEGLKVIKPRKSQSAQALLDIAEEAEKLTGSAPRDLAFNHDYYTWGGKKKKNE